jgi:hypothetical protein
MKKLLFSFLMVSVCFLGNAQLTAVTVEEIPLTGFVGATDFTGSTNYRLYAEVADAADQVTAVIGNDVCNADVSSTTSFYRSAAAGPDLTTNGINTFFFGFGALDLRYNSAVGIGIGAAGLQGVPEGEDPNGSLNPAFGAVDGLGAAIAGSTTVIGDGFAAFPTGGNIFINTFTGGTWFSTPGANTIGFGVNNSVFLGSFTTDGDFSFNISVGIQDDLAGNIDYINCDPANAGLGLSYPGVVLEGCTDGTACNYDAAAVVDDASCVFATGCDVCDGVGGVTDNPEAGDLCDDSDAGTENDMIQADCSCAGTPVAADPCSTAVDISADGTYNSGAIAGDLDATIGSCFVEGGSAMNWFFYTATADGEVTVSSFGIGGTDSEVAAATGTCAGGLTEIACNQDFTGGFPYESEITFAVTNGETYYIVWGNGWDDAAFDFTVAFVIPAVAPANDLCANAEGLATDGTVASGDNTDATATADDFGNDLSPDVWYSFVGTGNTVNIETFNNGGMSDSRIAVTDACGNASLDSDDDGGTGAMSLISALCTTLGTTYFVEVQGFGTTGGSLGSFDISVTDGGLVEYCSDALASNYNAAPGACDVENNATCSFAGCTSATALNYDENAATDDGSCIEPGCADAPLNWANCYAVSETAGTLFEGNTPADIVTLSFNAGTIEGGWDIITFYDGSDNTGAVIAGPLDGDLTGLVVQSTGQNMYVETVSDSSNSCGSGGQTAIDADYYCSAIVIEGCTDSAATNYDPTATTDDGSCSFSGCTSATALNYDVNATADDGSCIEAGCADAPLNWAYCYDSNESGGPVFTGNTPADIVTLVVNAGTMENTYDFITFYDGSDNTGAILAGPLTGDIAGLVVQSSGQNMYVEIDSDNTWSCVSGQNGGPAIDADYYCSAIVIAGCTDSAATNYDPTATVDDGSCIAPAVPNDTQAGAELLTLTAFGTCTSVFGTTDGATDSPESVVFEAAYGGSYIDVWYEIVATEAGVRVEVASGSMDCMLELRDDQGGLVTAVDDVFPGGGEILFGNLTPGNSYFLSVSDYNNDGASFEICAQELPASEVYAPNIGQTYPCSGYRGLSSTTGVSVAGGGTDWTFDDGVNTPINYSTPNSSVNLDVVPGLQPGTTYAVSIVPYYNNFGVTSQGTHDITIAAPSTGLKSQYVNSTVALSQNAYVRCLQNTACGYESFNWTITDVNTGVVSNVSTPGDLLFLSAITGVTYGAEYTAEIAVVYNGGIVSAYGAPQTFFTGDVPVTQLRSIFNSSNTTLTLAQDIQATPKVYLATDYEWSVERTDVTELPFVYVRGLAVRVARVNQMPLSAGGTYNLSIRPIVPGAVTAFGPVQEVVVIGGAGMVQDDEDTSPEIQEETVVKDNVISAAVTMYPNPAKDFVTLNITGIADGTDKVLVDIFNTVGQLVQSEQIPADGNYVNSVVTLNGLAEGMYNVQITVGNTVSTERMIIQK